MHAEPSRRFQFDVRGIDREVGARQEFRALGLDWEALPAVTRDAPLAAGDGNTLLAATRLAPDRPDLLLYHMIRPTADMAFDLTGTILIAAAWGIGAGLILSILFAGIIARTIFAPILRLAEVLGTTLSGTDDAVPASDAGDATWLLTAGHSELFERLEAQARQLQRAGHKLDQYTDIVSHDLRSQGTGPHHPVLLDTDRRPRRRSTRR